MSDFDKNALEEAIRIKEKLGDAEVFTLTVTAEDAKHIIEIIEYFIEIFQKNKFFRNYFPF
jgi:hypothetical protein